MSFLVFGRRFGLREVFLGCLGKGVVRDGRGWVTLFGYEDLGSVVLEYAGGGEVWEYCWGRRW